ncbi:MULTISPECIES: DUF1631 family protein [Deefgea]|uniref:DUF1631 family protein n=1 Tax=Deefgea chitinilytica TaxID=570276 RepID=A0ABS2C9E7_9NEIS|nr:MULTISPECIES: DUF1631 family protein [Deefgea]MBM5570774.1 DUF1631 family protein [Deefgea chitinilytica]MBM9888003.1 DUF1631 domain-containing protein [Deefgea sp. CFH1-16]
MSQPLPHSTPKQVQRAAAMDPMLMACRDLALKMLSQSLEGFFSRLEETYFELADKTFDRKLRDDYFAARVETHNKREFLAEQFRQNFLAAFNESLQATHTGTTQKSEGSFFKVSAKPDQLSLVANDEYEENLSADLIIKSFKDTGGEELTELEQRFAGLLPEQEDGAVNPMSPESICEAFLQACKQLETGLDARLVALKAFENELANQVADVYRHVNQYLIAQNVQRVVPQHQIKRNQNSPTSTAATAQTAQISSNLPESQTATRAETSPPLGAHLDALAAGNTNYSSSPVEHTPGWLSFLDVLQHKAPRLEGLSDENGAAIFQHNMLGMLRSSGWAKNLPPMDAMTLELIAMLFEHIFDDMRLSDSVKGLIGRLQIPVLKVAMLDAGFFANKHHCARLLLDRLAEASLDAPEMEQGEYRYDKLATIVAAVCSQFVDDVVVFQQALAELEDFLAHEAQQAEVAAQQEAQELVQHEIAELGLITAQELVSERLAREDVPDLVRSFIAQYWPKVLAKCFGAQGESGAEFVHKLKAMDDLIWSVQAKQGAEERFELVNLLPEMLKTLEDAARAEGMTAEESKSFFAQLVHCHAAAIRNGLRSSAETKAPAPLVTPIHSEPVIEPTQSEPDENLVFVTEASPSHPHHSLPIRGEWVEWISEQDDVLRLRLSWISPQQTRYLFTNRLGGNGKAFLKQELIEALTSGRIRRLALEGSLTDRALNELRSNLS